MRVGHAVHRLWSPSKMVTLCVRKGGIAAEGGVVVLVNSSGVGGNNDCPFGACCNRQL